MFFNKIERSIAKRYLKTKRKESFITIVSWFSLIGITLGVAVLIIVMSVMNGFKRDLIKSIIGIEGHITLSNTAGRFIDNPEQIIANIQKVNGVDSVGGSINTQALLNTSLYSTGAMVKALTAQEIEQRNIPVKYSSTIYKEQFEQNKKVALFGQTLYRSLQLHPGDKLKLVFPEFQSTMAGSIPKFVTVEVGGTFKTGMFQYDNNMVIIPMHIAQLVFATSGVQNIEVFLKDPNQSNSIRNNIEPLISFNIFTSTWQENNMALIGALTTERNVMFIILFLIIMIASFNIMSSLTMLARSKTREVAILKTLGLTNKNINNIFLLIGLRTGLVGSIAGVFLGIVLTLNLENIRQLLQNIFHISLFNENVYFLSNIPSEINFVEVAIVAISALLTCVLASIYPAKKVSKVVITKALHYE